MNKKLFLVTLALTGCLGLSAQTAMPFIRFDRDPATSALGGAQAASSVWNPAITAVSGSSNVLASFQSWCPKGAKATNLNLLGGVSFGKLGVTAVAAYQMGEAYPATGETGLAGEAITPFESLVGVGVGYAFTEALSFGANVKMASQGSGDGDSWNAFAADLFLAYRSGDLKLTAGVSSLGTAVGEYALPASATVGADYTKSFGTSGIKVVADVDYYFKSGLCGAVGVQYAFKDMVFVRAGYHLGSQTAPTPSYFSTGFGVKFSGFHIDASYLIAAANGIGGTFGLGLGYAF